MSEGTKASVSGASTVATRSLTVTERAFLAVWDRLFAAMFGWRQDQLNAAFVRTYGISGLMQIGKAIGDTLALLGKRFGEAQAQQIVGFAGLFNGCRFCGVGHNLTANMMIFRDKKVLYPIDEADVPHLQTLSDHEILAHFRERLTGTEFAADLALYERMLALRDHTTTGPHENDPYLKAALDLWVWNNECSIEVGLDVDPANVPAFLNWPTKDAAYQEYRAARAKS